MPTLHFFRRVGEARRWGKSVWSKAVAAGRGGTAMALWGP
jgi:hypothetical protein